MPVHKLEKIETSKEFIQLLTSLREKQMHPDNIRADINFMQNKFFSQFFINKIN